ncbi:MAG TPA: aminotransferase class III-fold pyridoxal phosphate-dependent enzyme, partial [Aquabacterium sp.]|nr:aminotransferase class III-fold pyridoxal phosphate-dependent enzyme [Aquabacterium sp.]
MPSVPNVRSLVHLLSHRAEFAPDAAAYVFLSEKEGQEPASLSYRELDARARFIASHLQAQGRQPKKQPVLLLFQPGLDYVAAFFGCLYAGAIPVPVYPPSSARRLPRLQAVLDDAQAHCAITTRADLLRIDTLQSQQRKLSITDWFVLDALEEQAAPWVDPGASADTIAFLQYTSGSTGSPKAVMVSHGNLLNNLEHTGRAIAVRDSDVTVSWLPPYHDFGLIGGILSPLFWGHHCVFMQPATFLLNPYRWLKAISDHRGTITSAPNFAYDLCVRSTTPEQRATLDLSNWRIAANGAEPVRVDTVRGFSRTFGPCGFRPESMVPGYGLAESTLVVAAAQGTPQGQAPAHIYVSRTALQQRSIEPCAEGDEAASLVSVGTVLPEHEVVIVDPHSLKRAAADAVGEVWVRGPSVAQGYRNRPDETRATFQAFVADSGEGPYLRTGDLGFFLDGALFICGRLKDLIIVNGRNIYPQDVENASFLSHPKLRVDGAIAFGVAGDGAERLVVVQELDFRIRPDEAMFGAIASAVADEVGLPPDSIVLVKAGQLPRTSSGKIQRQLCKQQFQDGDLPMQGRWDRPSPQQRVRAAQPPSDKAPAQPVAQMERWLIDRLAARVGLPVATVDPRQPFAYYGLDSLASVQLAEELSAHLRRDVPPTVFWEHPSIAKLADFLTPESVGPVLAPERPALTLGSSEPIAIVGMGCRFPQADDLESLWQLLEQGRVVTGPVPPPRIAAGSFVTHDGAAPATSLGGFLAQVDRFDPQFFGISPMEAERIDPQQRLVLEVAWEALENAGVPPARLAGTLAGVFVGISTHDYESRQALADDGLNVYAATGSAQSIAANRLSYLLDLRGPSVAVDTACSSSLSAVHMACRSLRSGESTLALVGGVNLILSSESGTPFASAGMLAADGRCKAFDAAADGYVRGEGCGMVVLKRLSDALRDGDTVRAVIRGSAIGQDGRSNGLIAPNGPAQVDVLRRALDDAQVLPASVAYLEAHGTGTVLGDPIELRALKEVLLPGRTAGQPCAIGTVKTNIGHLEAAAGVAGLIKTVLALEKGAIPPNPNYCVPNPHCALDDTPLSVPVRLQAWGGPSPRLAGVSSFGFGGALAHVVLQQAPLAPPSGEAWPCQLLTLSARTASELAAMSDGLAARLEASPGLSLADVAFSHQVGRQAFGTRRMLVRSTAAEAARALRDHAPDRIADGAGSASVPAQVRPVVLMFPGQGAQQLGMARELYLHLGAFRAEVEACAAIVRRHSGIDVRELIGLTGEPSADAAEQLAQTRHAQPALFVVEYAMARLWMHCGLQPQAMIGHSLGEYVAACLAGVFSLEDALALVAARGRLMQDLPEGAMLAVALNEQRLGPWLGRGVSLAAVNGRDRCVVSGSFADVQALENELTAQAVSHRRLQTSHAFHSHLMDPVLDEFGALVAGITLRAPALRFVSNLTGRWITDAEATAPSYWVRHLREPVRFAQGLATLAETTAATGAVLLEAGPGRTLATLARQHADANGCNWSTLPSLATAPAQAADLARHLTTLGQLWLGGQSIDWNAVHAGQQRRRLQLPTYPFQRQRCWIEGSPVQAHAPAPASPAEAHALQAAPQAASAAPAARRVDEIERETCIIVAELLRIEPHKVDPHAPLLELGADSLILVQAVNRIKKQFGITLSIRQLFEELTSISALATFIAQKMEPAPAAAAPAQPAAGAVAPRDVDEGASMLERTIARQLESLSQITQQTTQVLLQQLEAVRAGTRTDVAGQAVAAPKAVSKPTTSEVLSRPLQFDPYAELTPRQSAYLQQFMRRFLERTRGSRDSTVSHKAVHADYRAQAGFRFSAADPVLPLTLHELFYPILSERAAGSHIWDVDGNEYVDLTMGFGVHFFGHGPEFIQQALVRQLQMGAQIGPQSPLAGEVAQLVHELTGMERVAFCNSGTEAVMLAIRLARTATGREKFAMFNGSYHGWSDGSLVGVDIEQEEQGAAAPLMPGLIPGIGQHALVLEYAEAESLDLIRRHAHELAAVVVEPVQGRHPELQPREYLHRLRALTKELGIALIFDEVITGFRLHPGGAQALFGVRADIATYGKAAGGGMPLGLVAGDAHYMDGVDGGPRRRSDGRCAAVTTFFAGTFSKHPLTMAATRAVLQRMKREGPALQADLTRRTTGLVERINRLFEREQVSMHLVQCGSLFRLNTTANLDLICYHLVAHGLYIWEGRNMFLSTAHTDADLDAVCHAFEASIRDLRDGGFLPPLPPAPPSTTGSRAAGAAAPAAAPAAGRRGETLPLTATQQGIWLECRLDDQAALAYNTSIALRLRGEVNHAALGAALQHVVDRHDALRSVIDRSGEWQHVLPALRIELPRVSFAGSADAAAQVERWQVEESRQPFDLSQGPLLRAALLEQAAGEHLLCLNVHHVVSDGISDALLVQEIAQAYNALRQGAAPALPAAQALRGYVARRQAYLDSEQCRQDEAYWTSRFAQMPPPLALPTDRPPHRQSSLRAGRRQLSIGAEARAALQEVGRAHGCTLFMTLTAAMSVLLQRLTHQEDLVIGIPVAVDRPDGDEANLVGCTLNVVPLRCRPQASMPFARYLSDVKASLVEAYQHAGYPFALLVRKLGAAHDPQRRPLASVMFNIDRPTELPRFDGLQASLAESPMRFGQDDLMVDVTQLSDELIVKVQYKQDLFDAGTIERMAGHLQAL